eukprot:scaffold68752_cov62-Phaeocystis_antarctica.AAC.1
MTDLRGHVNLREPEPPTSPSAYPSVPTGFSFELGSTQRTFVFCARSASELQEWLCHLRSQIARARAAPSPGTATYAADWRGTPKPSARGGEAVTAAELGSSMPRVASRQAFASEGSLSDEALKSEALTIDLDAATRLVAHAALAQAEVQPPLAGAPVRRRAAAPRARSGVRGAAGAGPPHAHRQVDGRGGQRHGHAAAAKRGRHGGAQGRGRDAARAAARDAAPAPALHAARQRRRGPRARDQARGVAPVGPAGQAQLRHGHTQVRPRLRRRRRGRRRRGRGRGRVDVLRAARATAARTARRARRFLAPHPQADASLRPAALGAAAAVLRLRALDQGLLLHRAMHALPHAGLPVLPRHAGR